MPLLSRAAFNHFRRELQNFIQNYILINHICIIIIFAVLIVLITCRIHESLLLTVSWIAHNDSWHPSPICISFSEVLLELSGKQNFEVWKTQASCFKSWRCIHELSVYNLIVCSVWREIKIFWKVFSLYIQLNNQYVRLPDCKTMSKTFSFSS